MGFKDWDTQSLQQQLADVQQSYTPTGAVALVNGEDASVCPAEQSRMSLQSESIDELCFATPDKPLDSVTSWTEACPEETSRMDAGCSLQAPCLHAEMR